MNEVHTYIKCFWGKAGGARDNEPSWHPLAYHSLDVAACADILLARNPRRLEQLATLLQTSTENAQRFIAAIIALHDIGKFSPGFQAKSPEAWECSTKALLGQHHAPHAGVRHDADGFALCRQLKLKRLFEPVTMHWCASEFNTVWAAIAGHHGQPVSDADNTLDAFRDHPLSLDAADAFCGDIRQLFDPLDELPEIDERALSVLSWQLSGLTVLADWIGSNRAVFRYHNPDMTVAEYWEYIRYSADCAEKAVAQAGVLPAAPVSAMSAEYLLPKIASNLSPLQRHIANMALPDGPSLTLIEDVTGAGKTEAALLFAGRLMSDQRASGLFFALPTMATANAMYNRLRDIYGRLFEIGAKTSLVLAHGKRALNEDFSESILDFRPDEGSYEDDAAAVCSKWIADDRRKAFLAHVGVGTIDQALLGVLPSKHQSLRLWGLAERVLIIDEAHAYDAYMGREMERLLTFHAALGGSAIILSATLPEAQRSALIDAFHKGAGKPLRRNSNIQTRLADYPLVTVASQLRVTLADVETRTDRTRRLPVRRLPEFQDAVEEIADLARKGAAVAWIRNAVDDAADAVAALEAKGITPILLHARFAMGDRLDIEARVISRLGRDGTQAEREGFVVVGTQILEQSLDYDVDTMVVDLAPVDLVIQRAGRLWRHPERNQRPMDAPELLVVSPDPGIVEAENWYRQLSKRAAAVYEHHGIVWRSARVLFEAGEIHTPQGVRELIESVYGITDLDDIPRPLQKASVAAEGSRSAARSVAGANLLKLEGGYGGDDTIWSSDQKTPTRLGEPTTVFRLARRDGDKIVPWYQIKDDDNIMRAWALSEVALPQYKADGVPRPDQSLAAKIDEAKQAWPKWEQDMPLLLLERDGGIWRGKVALADSVVPVLYDKDFGLRFEEP